MLNDDSAFTFSTFVVRAYTWVAAKFNLPYTKIFKFMEMEWNQLQDIRFPLAFALCGRTLIKAAKKVFKHHDLRRRCFTPFPRRLEKSKKCERRTGRCLSAEWHMRICFLHGLFVRTGNCWCFYQWNPDTTNTASAENRKSSAVCDSNSIKQTTKSGLKSGGDLYPPYKESVER